jgi:uncharacterized membrane protein YkgB
MMHELDWSRARQWYPVATFLAIALVTVTILALLLKKTAATQLDPGGVLVFLIYLTIAGFLVLASRVFTRHDHTRRSA